MNTTSTERNEAGTARAQDWVSPLMLVVVAGTLLLLFAMVHNQPLADWMRRVSWEQNRWKKQLPLFCYTNHYVDHEERLFHEELSSADYSRGGVYFLGASTMKWSLKTWDLPEEIRPFVHNYAFGGAKPSDQGDFVRFLIKDEGLLRAGPEKTLLVFGTNYRIVHHGRYPGQGPSSAFTDLFTRHGYYTVGPDGTIHRTGQSPLISSLLIEPARMTGLMHELVNLVYLPTKSERVHDPFAYNAEWSTAMGSDWKEMMDYELAALGRTFHELKERKVEVAVLLFPMGTWERGRPFQPTYVEKLTKICKAEGVRILDYSDYLGDEYFADSDHLNPDGIEKFEKVITDISLDHLRSAGILPGESPSRRP